jgi:hypothetical protein
MTGELVPIEQPAEETREVGWNVVMPETRKERRARRNRRPGIVPCAALLEEMKAAYGE